MLLGCYHRFRPSKEEEQGLVKLKPLVGLLERKLWGGEKKREAANDVQIKYILFITLTPTHIYLVYFFSIFNSPFLVIDFISIKQILIGICVFLYFISRVGPELRSWKTRKAEEEVLTGT